MMIRLFVLDRHPITRFGLARMVDDEPDILIVGEASAAEAAQGQVAALVPDVITIDAEVDGGWELAHELRDCRADLGIVILTSNGEDDVLFRALETGASAFVPKTAPETEILGAIRHSAVAASSFSARGLADALRHHSEVSAKVALSPRETEVLALLQDGMSVPSIAATLFVSLSTAKTYVARLYEKLGANNRAQALMAAVELGLVDPSAHRAEVKFGS
jgi:DNA-binding NarL/FixJ family response regulator